MKDGTAKLDSLAQIEINESITNSFRMQPVKQRASSSFPQNYTLLRQLLLFHACAH